MRWARVQLVLLALVAVASLVYYGASVTATLIEVYGDRVPRNPTFHGFRLRAATGLEPEARQSGVHWGDPIVAINGRPFTGYNVLLEELRKSHAGDLMQMTIQPEGQAAHTVSIRLAPVYAARPGVLDLVSRIFFLGIFLPLACLLLGLWVLAARPWDKNAWFLFGILQYFLIIFGGKQFWSGAMFAFTGGYTAITILAGPLSIMFFGIYFPERSRLDLSYPWIKWVLTGILAALLPFALIYNYGFAFSYQSIVWLAPWMGAITRTTIVIAMIAFVIYFLSIGQKASTAASQDVRRRLRILEIGSS